MPRAALAPALVVFITALVHVSAPVAVRAQEPTTGGFLLAYAPGEREAFESGYRRHLEWHRAREDSLSWFGWDVIVGARPGAFVDGVFGVPFRALDVRVDPAGDRADAAANVRPFADPLSRELIALRPDLSTATPLERDGPSPWVQVVWYEAAPGRVADVEAALSALRGRAGEEAVLPYTVYERVAGAGPGFVLLVWRERLGSFDEHGRNPSRVLRRTLRDPASVGEVDGPVRAAWSEIWRYRPDLTHQGSGREER